jgi:hypothetical protein
MTDQPSTRFPLYPFLATVALALIKTWGLLDIPWPFVFLPLFFKFAAGLAAALLSGAAMAIIMFGGLMWATVDFFRK